MISPKISPLVLIALDLYTAIVYYYYGDFRHFVYWLAAAVLTASVTF